MPFIYFLMVLLIHETIKMKMCLIRHPKDFVLVHPG